MKLNYKRTLLVGLAFLSISAFWQMYDGLVPKILTETFHLDETYSGVIMAMDNILALFMLPFFGALSDRIDTKLGRRTPFILGGTAAAVVLMNLLPIPALDGGRAVALLLTVAIETITRRKIDPKHEGRIHAIGMILLLGLTAVIMLKDIFVIFKG